MPLPLGQIAAFAGITVPYVLILTLIGIPFNHNLFWLYVLPPGVLTWLVTRPVLENKKLPELLVSQVRYLGEPNVWCRMAPSAEKDEIVVVGRVWHASRRPVPQAAAEFRQPVPEPVYASGPQAWAPAPGGQRRQAPPRHRRPPAGGDCAGSGTGPGRAGRGGWHPAPGPRRRCAGPGPPRRAARASAGGTPSRRPAAAPDAEPGALAGRPGPAAGMGQLGSARR